MYAASDPRRSVRGWPTSRDVRGVQEYGEPAERHSLIKKVPGYMRELGRAAFTDAYVRIDPKVDNAFPFIEADKYRQYYKEYLCGLGTSLPSHRRGGIEVSLTRHRDDGRAGALHQPAR